MIEAGAMWADKLSCDKFFTRLGAELWPCMHGVMDVNPALRILADAVRIAIPDAGQQDATVVKNLVFVIAITEDPPLRTRFVGGLQDQGPGETVVKVRRVNIAPMLGQLANGS